MYVVARCLLACMNYVESRLQSMIRELTESHTVWTLSVDSFKKTVRITVTEPWNFHYEGCVDRCDRWCIVLIRYSRGNFVDPILFYTYSGLNNTSKCRNSSFTTFAKADSVRLALQRRKKEQKAMQFLQVLTSVIAIGRKWKCPKGQPKAPLKITEFERRITLSLNCRSQRKYTDEIW